MGSQTQVALLTAFLTFFGAIIGYFLREYQNRAKPFIAIKEVRGDMYKDLQSIKISKDTIKELDSSVLIKKLIENDILRNVEESFFEAHKINKYGNDLIELIDNTISAINNKDEDNFLKLISQTFMGVDYNYWILVLVTSEQLNPPNIKEDLPIKIEIIDSDEYDGSVWFNFTRGATNFGEGFHESPILRAKSDFFIKLIQTIDFEGLANVFFQIRNIFEKELMIAKDLVTKLDEIRNENSSWEIQLYVANLGRTPFLINNTAQLEILEESGAKLNEECLMALLNEGEDNELSSTETLSPLVLGSEQDTSFSFITKNQSKMKKGKLLRVIYNSGKSECQLFLNIEQVGFKRNKILKTPKFTFKKVV